MRIITGRFKGRRLRPVDDRSVRSTSDRVKESLFNILAADLAEADVLDLFCGAGTLGLEALSRGARHVTFVDAARRSIVRTTENAALVQARPGGEVTILQSDVLKALREFARQGRTFSIVFADPPYEEGWSRRLPDALVENGVLAEDAIVVLEHHRKEPPAPASTGYSLWTERRFGDTMLSIWRWSSSGSGDDRTAATKDTGGGIP